MISQQGRPLCTRTLPTGTPQGLVRQLQEVKGCHSWVYHEPNQLLSPHFSLMILQLLFLYPIILSFALNSRSPRRSTWCNYSFQRATSKAGKAAYSLGPHPQPNGLQPGRWGHMASTCLLVRRLWEWQAREAGSDKVQPEACVVNCLFHPSAPFINCRAQDVNLGQPTTPYVPAMVVLTNQF